MFANPKEVALPSLKILCHLNEFPEVEAELYRLSANDGIVSGLLFHCPIRVVYRSLRAGGCRRRNALSY
ncbi:hypothetical protein PAAL109150_27125 [Paenibacillus alkaliterrae]